MHSAYRNVVVSWEAVARSIPHLWESNNALRKPSNGPRLQVSFTVFIQVFLLSFFFCLFCLRFWIFSFFHIAIIFYTTFSYLLTALLLIYNKNHNTLKLSNVLISLKIFPLNLPNLNNKVLVITSTKKQTNK